MGVIIEEIQQPWFRFPWSSKANYSGSAHEQGESPAYDLVDVMERGEAREVTPHLEERQGSESMRECSVMDVQGCSILFDEDKQALLIAQPQSGGSFDIYVAGDIRAPASRRPAFQLLHNQRCATWELRAAHCQHCAYRRRAETSASSTMPRTLLRVRQERVAIGPCGTFRAQFARSSNRPNAMATDVEVPATSNAWCEGCQASGLPQSSAPATSLTTRLPKWSSKLRALTLDFSSRCMEASVRNFQLTTNTEGSGPRSDAELQFGLGLDSFCLDFKGSLGPVQAFALALTSTSWPDDE